jgi:predicted TIM-barrel fold metal-dependent hydrolase
MGADRVKETVGRPPELEVVDAFLQVYPGARGTDLPMPRENLRDADSLAAWPSSDIVAHLFGDAAERKALSRDAGRVVEELDRWGIRCAQVPVALDDADEVLPILAKYPGRFYASVRANPHDGMTSVRALQRLTEEYGIVRSCSITPAMLYPPIAPDSREYYPLYAKCVELSLPVYVNVGIPGPRVPSRHQHPMSLDDVCWFFPELTVVMRHGGEPWADVCVRLMLKWPNLYYATSAFAPRYLPQEIVHYANTRGSEKVMYAGYWPTISFEDAFEQLDELKMRRHVWPKFLSENATRVFGLTG